MFRLLELNSDPAVNDVLATYTTSPFLYLLPSTILNPADQLVICALATSA